MGSEFDKIVSADTNREDELLLPVMQDPRIGKAVLAETLPQLSIDVDVDSVIKEIAQERNIDESLVRQAFERAKGKFEREQEHGY